MKRYLLSFAALFALVSIPVAVFAADSTAFVPLTNIPALLDAGTAVNTADGLSLFLNNLYKICIGIAAVLAVLKIMQAGIMYMGSDSGFAEKKEAKAMIGLAIGGLVLVLSPVIVFSIINPSILSLKINNISSLATPDSQATLDNILWSNSKDLYTIAAVKCVTDDHGIPVAVCATASNSTPAPVSDPKTCVDPLKITTVCSKVPGDTSALPNTCADYAQRQAAPGGVCDAGNGFAHIDATCCGTLSAGAVCCGSKEAAKPIVPPNPSGYGWKGIFTNNNEAQTGAQMSQQGPFDTAEKCQTSLRDWPVDNNRLINPDGKLECTCETPLKEQPDCHFES